MAKVLPFKALGTYPYDTLARTIWTTVKNGREHARAGRQDDAFRTVHALLDQDPACYPPLLVRLIQDGIDGIYEILGVPKPFKKVNP